MAPIASIEYFRLPPRWLFVKITDTSGAFGWGEASLEGHTQAVEGCLDAWIEKYVGAEADDIEQIWQLSWRTGFYRGGPVLMSALAGLDIALWDLKARKLNLPIYQLLGGKVRDRLRVYAWIGGDRPADVEIQANARKAQGFNAVKMNGTEDLGWLDSPSALDSAVERLKTVKALGMDAGIDFHGRVHKPMAKQLAKALEPHRPLFIEEPLLSEHIGGIKALAQVTSTPIALGERLHSRWDVRPFLEAGCVDILQPDVCHVGGISEMKRIAAMAEAYDVALAPYVFPLFTRRSVYELVCDISINWYPPNDTRNIKLQNYIPKKIRLVTDLETSDILHLGQLRSPRAYRLMRHARTFPSRK